MNEPQILGFILICQMIGLVYVASSYISTANCNGHGIYHVIINAWFRGNKRYREWLKNNRDYQWCFFLILSLCPMILLLIEPFRQNKMFIRPEASLYINVALWGALLGSYYTLTKKRKKLGKL